MVEHNHGKGFYELLLRVMPAWKEVRGKFEVFDFRQEINWQIRKSSM